MKHLVLALSSALLWSTASYAATSTYPFTYYGNVSSSSIGTCAGISGDFPAILNYEYTASPTTPTFYALKILIQNPAIDLVPQYAVYYLTPSSPTKGTFAAQDPLLFGPGTSISGINGTYTDTAIGIGADTVAIDLQNVQLTATFNGGSCTVTLNGPLYFSP